VAVAVSILRSWVNRERIRLKCLPILAKMVRGSVGVVSVREGRC